MEQLKKQMDFIIFHFISKDETKKDNVLLQHLSTCVEPVKATLLMSLWLAIAAPAVGPKPGMMLTTPGGNPACSHTVTLVKSFKDEFAGVTWKK